MNYIILKNKNIPPDIMEKYAEKLGLETIEESLFCKNLNKIDYSDIYKFKWWKYRCYSDIADLSIALQAAELQKELDNNGFIMNFFEYNNYSEIMLHGLMFYVIRLEMINPKFKIISEMCLGDIVVIDYDANDSISCSISCFGKYDSYDSKDLTIKCNNLGNIFNEEQIKLLEEIIGQEVKVEQEEDNPYQIYKNNILKFLKPMGLDEETLKKYKRRKTKITKAKKQELGEELYECLLEKNINTAKIIQLIKDGADVNYKEEEKGNFPLNICARKGDDEVFISLIQAGADINQSNNYGTTALMSAARHGNSEMVKILIALGADVNAKCIDGDTAIMSATIHNQQICVELLAQAQAHINSTNLNNQRFVYQQNASKLENLIQPEQKDELSPMDLIEEAQLKLSRLK